MHGGVLFCTDTFWNDRSDEMAAIDPSLEVVRLTGDEQVSEADLERITIAFFSPDAWSSRSTAFMGSCLRAPNLAWLHSFSAGTEHAVFSTFRGRGVTVTSGAGGAAPSIAQTVITYLLAFSRDLPQLARDQQARRWAQRTTRDLAGMRLGIVGLGAIGTEVARLANAFEMDVIGLRRTITGHEPCPTWSDDRFGELLAWADVIAVTAPLTDRTRGMFDASALAAMRPGAWFVNVGRGEIVDEEALVEALRSGHIGAAGLDVFVVEPLPEESPLWTMPNVIITPHTSGETTRSDQRSLDLFVDNFRRFAGDQPLFNVTADELAH